MYGARDFSVPESGPPVSVSIKKKNATSKTAPNATETVTQTATTKKAAAVSKTDVEDALRDVGLGGRGADFPDQLSLGQQRRLALARAFAMRPDLLLLDEPFVSLDPDLVEEMMALFARLRAARKVATILVTHVEDEAKRLASRIVTLGGQPATIVNDVQNEGAYFQLSASGVTSSRS